MALRSPQADGLASKLGRAPVGAASLVTLALLAAACGGADDNVSFDSGGAAGNGGGTGGRGGGAQGGSQSTGGGGGTSSKGGSAGTSSKGGSGGTSSKGGAGGSASNGGSAGEDGGSAGTAGQSDGGKGRSGGGNGGKAGSTSGGKGGAAGKAGAGGKAGSGSGGKGGTSPAGAGGSDTAGAGGSDTAGAGGSDTAGAGGSDTAGAGGSDTAGSGGSDTAGSGGTNNGGSGGSPPSCGDGIRNQLNEQCDGTDFGANTPGCPNGGTGTVTCNGNCTRNFSACVAPSQCGNGNVNPGEECDAQNPRCQACKIVCGNEEKRFENRCYGVTLPRSFAEAEAACVQRGGHLVTIGSSAENNFIYDLAGGNSGQPLAAKIWIGLNDRNTEGSFTWVSGSSGTFRNFRDGEPNAFTTTEDCAAMYLQLGTWNDDECTKQFVGVCEFNPQGS